MRIDALTSLGPCPTCRSWVIRATLYEASDPGRTVDELAMGRLRERKNSMTRPVPVQLSLPAAIVSPDTQVVVGGTDVSRLCHSLTLSADVNELTTMTLHLRLRSGARVDGEALVRVDDQTHAVLVALGWTPPKATA